MSDIDRDALDALYDETLTKVNNARHVDGVQGHIVGSGFCQACATDYAAISHFAAEFLPTVTQAIRAAEQRARDTGYQQGRKDAEKAIKASDEGRMHYSTYYPNGLHVRYDKSHFARLARCGSTDEEQTQ